jgi:geranylgeranyl diphosphate synthase, type II
MHLLTEFLGRVRTSVGTTLESLVPPEDHEPAKLHQAIRWSLFAGGKRIRPAIVIAAGEACGASEASLLKTAAAIEMVHTYSLIHDDLPSMDDDDLRRGQATCHVQFGEATAILAGDVLQTLAFRAIAEDELLSPELRIEVIRLLAYASGTPCGMASGQQLDLEAEGRDLSISEIENIHRQKTGALITASAVAGAQIASAPAAVRHAISEYANKLGLLFQITDDLLDVTQATESLGKTAGKDTAAAKATYPAFYGVDGTKELASRIRDEAQAALSSMGERSLVLSKLADLVVDRTN